MSKMMAVSIKLFPWYLLMPLPSPRYKAGRYLLSAYIQTYVSQLQDMWLYPVFVGSQICIG